MSNTLTTRLGLVKPTPGSGENVNLSTLNTNLDRLDSTAGFTVCTSGTRPSSPYQGQQIYETNTTKILYWDGSTWDEIQQSSNGFLRLDATAGISLSGQTSEQQVATLTGSLINGRTYRIWVMTNCSVTNADTAVWFRVREDNTAGAIIRGAISQHKPDNTSTLTFDTCREFVATATGSKTFSITLQRGAGSGTYSCFSSQSQYTLDRIN